MLNDALYQALSAAYGQVGVVNENLAGVFRHQTNYKKVQPIQTAKDKKVKQYADVTKWGEIYTLNCPACGDTRGRLAVGHLCGCTLKVGNRWCYFSSRMYKCHNEGCNLTDHFKQDLPIKLEKLIPSAEPTRVKSRSLKNVDVVFPRLMIPITSDGVPEAVRAYLLQRRFDPYELWYNYQVHYCPPGAAWTKVIDDGKPRTFKYDRLLIPIFRGYHIVGWQARLACDLEGEEKRRTPKYITYGEKTEMLYNMDEAKWHRHIAIVEGVTDVWRIGGNAVALLGKTLSATQLEIIKALWGHDGAGALCLDADDPQAVACAQKIYNLIREEGVFPDGILRMLLTVGKDPGDMVTSNIREHLRRAFVRLAEIMFAAGQAQAEEVSDAE